MNKTLKFPAPVYVTSPVLPPLVAIRHNMVLKKYYQQLVNKEGKTKMVAIITAMRKLLCIMNAMLKNNRQWEPKIV